MPHCKSVDIGKSGHDRQEADRRRYQGLASNAGPEVRCHAPPPFRRALVDRCHWRPDRRGCLAPPAQVRPRKPAAADRHSGWNRDFRNRRPLAVEGGQQARPGPRIRHVQVLLPKPAGRNHHGDCLPPAGSPDLHDKNMDPQTKKVAGGAGTVLAVIAALIGVSYHPPSVEQYTEDMNTCAAQIKAGQPTTACSPDVAAQAQEIATDSATVAAATKDAAHPAGQDVVYWIAPENGAKKSETPHVFHLCAAVSPLKDKTVNSGSVTEAYAQNAIRITKQIEMEQKQCGFSVSQ